MILCSFESTAQKIKKLERTSSYSILIIGDTFQGLLFEERPLTISTPQGLGELKPYNPILRDVLFAEEGHS